MCAYEDPGIARLTEQQVEPRAVAPSLDRVHPYEEAVETKVLRTHCVSRLVRVEDRLSVRAKRCKSGEHAMQLARLDVVDGVPLSTPKKTHARLWLRSCGGQCE